MCVGGLFEIRCGFCVCVCACGFYWPKRYASHMLLSTVRALVFGVL